MVAKTEPADSLSLVPGVALERAVLAAVFAAKAAITLALYALGFAGVSADEYSRSIAAMQWAHAPHLIVGKIAWLPFELYLDGTLLKIIPDPLWVPRATAFIASCLLLLFFYRLVRLLYAAALPAAVSTLGLLVFPWYVWMGATPMLDEYYLAAICAGLLYAARWIIEGKTGALYGAALAFFLASGFHYQAWMVLAVIDFAGLWLLVRLLRAKDWRNATHLCVATILAHAYIAFTLTATYLDTGNPLAFIASHNKYTKWFFHGYQVSRLQKLLYYPKLLIANVNPIFGVFALYGAALPAAARMRLRVHALPMLGVGVLAGYSLFNVWSVPPAAAPDRFSLVFYLLLLPYAGRAFAALAARPPGGTGPAPSRRAAWPVVACLSVGVLWGLNQIRAFPDWQDWNGALRAGRVISRVLQQADAASGYLIELDYWHFLGVELTAGHYDRRFLDREYDLYQPHLPSLLAVDADAFAAQLRTDHIVAMAFHTPDLIARAAPLGEVVAREGGWVVMRVREK